MKKIYAIFYISLIIIVLNIGHVFGVNTTNNSSNTQVNNKTQEEIEKEEKKAKNENKNLSYLKIDGYELSPEFNKNTLNYYVIIPKDVTSLDIDTEPEQEGAIVRISGDKKLTKQENTINITVTAINGTSRTYRIIASKEPEVNLKLDSLNIDGVDLKPVFDENTYYYTSSLEDTELNDLNVNAVANDPNAKIEILGAEDIIDGENLINIVLTNEEETTIYQVNIEVDKLGEKEKEADNVITRVRKIMKYATIGIVSLIALIILIIIISIIVRKVRKKKE